MGDAESDNSVLQVEVIYALPDEQCVRKVAVKSGSTVADVIAASSVRDKYPEIDLAIIKVGIFSRLCSLDTLVRQGDRIELYRPLQIDPMEARRRRADASKQGNKHS